MPDKTTSKRFETLLSEYLDDGIADEERQQEFIKLLKSDPVFTEALRTELMMDARLRQFENERHSAGKFTDTLAATVAAETNAGNFIDSVVAEAGSSERKPAVPGLWRILAISAFTICLLLGGLMIGENIVSNKSEVTIETDPVDDGVAVLVNAAGVSSLQVDDILSPGRLQIEDGVMELEFYSGARLVVEGPADLELISPEKVICRKGRVRAIVPPAARGFTVVAPQFELVDLGTEFGLSVDPGTGSKVQVFDGEVEIYPPDQKRSADAVETLLQGDGIVWGPSGKQSRQPSAPEAFPSFDEVRKRREWISQRRFAKWAAWNEAVANDPRVAFHYDFETEGSVLLDRGPTASHGAIVGAEWADGRFSSGRALEFKRPGDRVRIDLPGSFDELTLSTWLRMDALPGRSQGLLLTEKYEVGRLHWHIHQLGTLRLGVRIPSENARYGATGYGSPVLFTPRKIGIWTFLCTVYDRKGGTLRHYLNGKEVSSHDIVFDQPLQIGAGDIGNWIPKSERRRSVRNFVGRIDELTIWKVAMNDDEIQEMYRMSRH